MEENQFIIIHNKNKEIAVNTINVSHIENYGDGVIIHFLGSDKKIYADESLHHILEIIGKGNV